MVGAGSTESRGPGCQDVHSLRHLPNAGRGPRSAKPVPQIVGLAAAVPGWFAAGRWGLLAEPGPAQDASFAPLMLGFAVQRALDGACIASEPGLCAPVDHDVVSMSGMRRQNEMDWRPAN